MFMWGKSPMVTTTPGVRDLGCGHNPTSAPGSAATGKTSGAEKDIVQETGAGGYSLSEMTTTRLGGCPQTSST